MVKNNSSRIKRNKLSSQTEYSKYNILKLSPIIIFTSVVIFITRLKIYENTYNKFWWNQLGQQLVDFFSYYKMGAIIITASCSICILIFLYIRKDISIKPTRFYIPIVIYSIFVIISYALSEYKEFSLFGWEDRFEGTLVLLSYMIMLFYIINVINSQQDVKIIIYSILAACCILGILGITQATGHDFFASDIGKKLIVPQEYWGYLDELSFKFKHNEIYQTVYNINYVSFYLTLVIPLVGALFLLSAKRKSKVIYTLIFTLLVYNMFGAASSGGILGLAVSCIMAIIIFGRKLLNKKKEIAALIILTSFAAVLNLNTLAPELNNTIRSSLLGESSRQTHELSKDAVTNISNDRSRPSIEFIETNKDSVTMSLSHEIIRFNVSNKSNNHTEKSLSIVDGTGKSLIIATLTKDSDHMYAVSDERFKFLTMDLVNDGENEYLLINLPDTAMAFLLQDNDILYRTSYGSLVDLSKVEALGFKGNEGFGSGRGYIWSRSLPLLKDTLLWGNGADTFAVYFPQDDFAGKYTGPSFSRNINSVIRKPHSLYLGTAINTGMISLIALLALFLLYIVQSLKIYRKENLDSFYSKAGAGVFLGICGFLADGVVYDSNVCVMPLFYGLLGTGVAINLKLIKPAQ